MEGKPRFCDPEKVSLSTTCPYNRGKRYKDCVNIFSGPNFVSPEWRCPLNRGVPKENVPLYYIKLFPSPFCNRFFFPFMTLTPYASNFFLFFVFCRIVICGSTIAYHFPTPQILRLVSHNSRFFWFPRRFPLLIACH